MKQTVEYSKRAGYFILFIISLLLIDRLITKGPDAEKIDKDEFYRVIDVHDGDTVSIEIGGAVERIRLIGIDTPEMGQKPWGQRAKTHLEKILKNAQWSISLEYDIEKRDKYGRLLAYLWTEDKKMLNLMMLQDGYGLLLTIPPNVKYVDELREAQARARENKLGIWGKGGLKEKPGDYRERHRGKF